MKLLWGVLHRRVSGLHLQALLHLHSFPSDLIQSLCLSISTKYLYYPNTLRTSRFLFLALSNFLNSILNIFNCPFNTSTWMSYWHSDLTCPKQNSILSPNLPFPPVFPSSVMSHSGQKFTSLPYVFFPFHIPHSIHKQYLCATPPQYVLIWHFSPPVL